MSNVKASRKGKSVKPSPMPDLSKSFSPQLLAKAISAKRTGLKLSLEDVVKVLSISKPTLVKIEKGDTNVKLATLLLVMEYLGLSFSLISDETADHKGNGDDHDEWY